MLPNVSSWLAIFLCIASSSFSFFVPVTSVFPLVVANQPTASTKGPTTLDKSQRPPGASRSRPDAHTHPSPATRAHFATNFLLFSIYSLHVYRSKHEHHYQSQPVLTRRVVAVVVAENHRHHGSVHRSAHARPERANSVRHSYEAGFIDHRTRPVQLCSSKMAVILFANAAERVL